MLNESSDAVVIRIDLKICRLSAIKKAAYSFGDRCFVRIESDGDRYTNILLTSKHRGADLRSLEGEFRNELLDQELREVVAEETVGVRNLLLAQAFSATSLIDASGETGDLADDPLAIASSDRQRQG